MNIHKERMKGKINMKEKNSIDKGTMKIFAVVIFGLGLAFGFGPAARTATPSPEAATSSGFQFVADAYGTQANLGNVVVAGKTAVSTLGPCGIVTPPVHDENTVASTDASPLNKRLVASEVSWANQFNWNNLNGNGNNVTKRSDRFSPRMRSRP